ncbi:MAG: argininosuccinate synthase, partial [Candidatus Hecatellales archaeon ex4484_218]
MDKVVLAYSGGLDTSVMVNWLTEKYGFEVITVTLDVGQQENLKVIEEKAKIVGAVKHYTIDAKKEFVERFIFPAIKANALYEGKYPLSSALSRPLIAEKLVEIAKKENASAVAHGCTGRGNDQVRFEVTIEALAPELKIIAPVREWKLTR